jgi:hypothetical protein
MMGACFRRYTLWHEFKKHAEGTLSTEAYTKAWERGQALDASEVIQQLLSDYIQ